MLAANVIGNMGVVAWHQGDFVLAEKYYRRSLALAEKVKPNSPEVAVTLTNVGDRLLDRGRFAEAERYLLVPWLFTKNLIQRGFLLRTT